MSGVPRLTPGALSPAERELVADALLGACLLRPYYGRALHALRPVAAPGLGTVGVDRGWRLYVDPAWFAGLRPAERAGVLAGHEVEHLVRDHADRLALVGPLTANVAGDLEIDTPGMADLACPPGGVTPAALGLAPGLLAEEYARQLLDRDDPEPGGCCGGGSGAGRPLEGELPSDGGAAGAEAAALEPGAAEALRDAVAADVRAHVAAHGRGSVPARVEVWAEARARRPAYDWRRRLAAVVGRVRSAARGRGDWSWSRSPRRQPLAGCLRPGTVATPPRIAVVVDTSASMDEDGPAVLGHVEAVARASGDVRWIACDADVAGSWRRLPSRWLGGGGTDMRVGLEAAARARPHIIVVITDGMTPWPIEAPAARVVIVLTQDTEAPPWAEVVRCAR